MAFTLALACLLVVGALGFTLFTASEDLEESLISQIVTEEMEYLIKRHKQNSGFTPQPSSNLQSYIVRDANDRSRLPAFLLGLAPGRHEFFIGKEEIHALVRDAGEVRYYVAYEVGLHEQREREFKLLVLLSVLTAALTSLALGYWLSGVLVRQVTDLSRQVSKLKPGERRETLAQPGQDAEVAMLAGAFDDYQARIEQMIRREQEFTANVSHELRTPLAMIKGYVETLLDGAKGDPATATRFLQTIARHTDRLTYLIEDLLTISKLESGQLALNPQPLCPREVVQRVFDDLEARATERGTHL